MINLAHVHPMLVHFPLALLPVAVTAQVITVARGDSLFARTYWARTGIMLLALSAAGAILAATFGDMALDKAIDSGVALSRMEDHEELGMLSVWLLVGLAAVEGWFYYRAADSKALSFVAASAGLAVLLVLLTTGWFGGHLVYDLGVNVSLPT